MSSPTMLPSSAGSSNVVQFHSAGVSSVVGTIVVVAEAIVVTVSLAVEASAAVVREYLADVRPANTTVVCDLMTPEMKIEIEATAYRGS